MKIVSYLTYIFFSNINTYKHAENVSSGKSIKVFYNNNGKNNVIELFSFMFLIFMYKCFYR